MSNWLLIIPFWIGYQVIGMYVAYSAHKNGYLRMMVSFEWAFAVSSWPWLLLHIRKVNKERDLIKPFEDYMDRWEQEQLDK